jgi:hypothetical protein
MRPLDRPVGPLVRSPSILGIGLAALLLGAAAAGVQGEGSLRFEKTVPWETGKRIPLGATVKLDHPILKYVVPMIDRVRLRLEARLD